jgi:predicted ATPase
LVEVGRALYVTRLLTLTGAGGSGKTRLALEVARDLVGAYPDGVWLVELASLSEGALLPQVVAAVLEVHEQPDHSLTDTLIDALRNKKVLLVLDNCEHLIDAAARLTETLLDACPGLQVLVTSREALRVDGESVWQVDPLSVPGQRDRPTVEELEGYESAQLFVERALFVERVLYGSSGFALTPGNASAVAEICRRLEGIPLAIELAAAWAGTLSVEQISERLKVSLGLLKGGRTLTRRQQTLRGAMDWSYDLLTEPEQRLFERLSVFAGGWTLEAAEVVGASDDVEEEEVLELLWRLVNKSLVVAEARTAGTARYRMLEPIRQYAREKLETSGEADEVKDRHAAFFLALAEEAEPELAGAQQTLWVERLEGEVGVNLSSVTTADLDADNLADLAVADEGYDDLNFERYPDDVWVLLNASPPPDTMAPQVQAMSPANLTTGVSLTANAEVTFSEVMDPNTLTTGTFTLTKQGSPSPVAARVSYDAANKKAILDPDSDLEANTSYTAIIKGGSNGAKDLAGNALAQDYSWSFTTASPRDTTAPKVDTVSPANAATGVVRSTNLTATFSEKMDPASITKATFKLYKCTSTTSTNCTKQVTSVTVSLGTDGLRATLNPYGTSSTLLASKTRYMAVVTAGTKDVAGNALDQDPSAVGNQQQVWYFTTGRT